MSYFEATIHQIRLQKGALCPRPRWESTQHSQTL